MMNGKAPRAVHHPAGATGSKRDHERGFDSRLLHATLILKIMKEFINIMIADLQEEGYTKKEWMIYGVIAPAVFVLTCILL